MKHYFKLVLVMIIISFALTANAETNGFDTEFDIKAGCFLPSEDAMDEIYGASPVIGADIILWSNRFGMSLGASYMYREGDPETYGNISDASSELTVASFHLTGLYRVYDSESNRKIFPYFGVGVVASKYKEELEIESGGYSGSDSVSENAYGLHALVGADFQISDKSSLFLEADISSAKIDGKMSEDFDVGGITLFAGIRF